MEGAIQSETVNLSKDCAKRIIQLITYRISLSVPHSSSSATDPFCLENHLASMESDIASQIHDTLHSFAAKNSSRHHDNDDSAMTGHVLAEKRNSTPPLDADRRQDRPGKKKARKSQDEMRLLAELRGPDVRTILQEMPVDLPLDAEGIPVPKRVRARRPGQACLLPHEKLAVYKFYLRHRDRYSLRGVYDRLAKNFNIAFESFRRVARDGDLGVVDLVALAYKEAGLKEPQHCPSENSISIPMSSAAASGGDGATSGSILVHGASGEDVALIKQIILEREEWRRRNPGKNYFYSKTQKEDHHHHDHQRRGERRQVTTLDTEEKLALYKFFKRNESSVPPMLLKEFLARKYSIGLETVRRILMNGDEGKSFASLTSLLSVRRGRKVAIIDQVVHDDDNNQDGGHPTPPDHPSQTSATAIIYRHQHSSNESFILPHSHPPPSSDPSLVSGHNNGLAAAAASWSGGQSDFRFNSKFLSQKL